MATWMEEMLKSLPCFLVGRDFVDGTIFFLWSNEEQVPATIESWQEEGVGILLYAKAESGREEEIASAIERSLREKCIYLSIKHSRFFLSRL